MRPRHSAHFNTVYPIVVFDAHPNVADTMVWPVTLQTRDKP